MKTRNYSVFCFVAGYHLMLLALLPAFINTFSWPSLVLLLITYVVGGLSITAGYHRLFAHRAYRAHPVFEWMVLLGSTLAFEWSALVWAHDHRLHHAHVDTDADPYSIKKGLWYAHMGWLFTYQRSLQSRFIRDLENNPRVMFQDRHYLLLAIAVNVAVVAIGCLFMHPVAAFYAGFLLRVFAIHHCTWFINSLAHVWGSKTFARELSAVDNAFLALITFGEGYHNYHHAFAGDYRNGIRWYHFDPTKWIIWMSSRLGMVKGLRPVNRIRLQRILVGKDKILLTPVLQDKGDEPAAYIRNKLEELDRCFQEKTDALTRMVGEIQTASRDRRRLMRLEIRRLKKEINATWDAWINLTKYTVKRYQLPRAHSS